MSPLAHSKPGETFAGYTQLEVDVCVVCGIMYAVPAELLKAKSDHGGSWHCPNGHSIHYAETMEQKLKREREQNAQLTSQLDQSEASNRALRGVVARSKREKQKMLERIANGVCPCCQRSFTNVRRHMASKHPEVLAELA